jgi:hypothetical protein
MAQSARNSEGKSFSWDLSSTRLLRKGFYIFSIQCRPIARHCANNEIHVTATPLDSAYTNCDARNFFRMCIYENCRVSLRRPYVFLKYCFNSHASLSLIVRRSPLFRSFLSGT